MSKHIFSENQVQVLRNNPNVAKCSSKSITYSKDFKMTAVKACYDEGQSPNMIFVNAGLGLDIISKSQPKACLKRWKNIYKSRGQEQLTRENRGRKKGKRFKDDESDPNYLKIKISYLEAENDFLRQLKTKRKT